MMAGAPFEYDPGRGTGGGWFVVAVLCAVIIAAVIVSIVL